MRPIPVEGMPLPVLSLVHAPELPEFELYISPLVRVDAQMTSLDETSTSLKLLVTAPTPEPRTFVHVEPAFCERNTPALVAA